MSHTFSFLMVNSCIEESCNIANTIYRKHQYMPVVEPAWHRREQKQRAAARKLLRAVDALLAAAAEVPSHLATAIPQAIAHIQNHHGSAVPARVLHWHQMQGTGLMNNEWQTMAHGKKRRSWLWTPQAAERYSWVACNRGGCKAWVSWDCFTYARCACGRRWSDDILETAHSLIQLGPL